MVTTALLQGRPRSTEAEAAENASARTTLRMVVRPVMVWAAFRVLFARGRCDFSQRTRRVSKQKQKPTRHAIGTCL